MVNLIRREGSHTPWSALDPIAHARYLERLASARALWDGAMRERAGAGRDWARALRPTGFEPDLEPDPGFPALEACLVALETARRKAAGEHSAAPAIAGRLLVFEPGVSLATGEAEAASRAFIDIEDRPPWATWLVAIQRPASPGAGGAPAPPHTGVLAWIPAQAESLADAGISACPTRSLRWLDTLSGPLAEQLGRSLPHAPGT